MASCSQMHKPQCHRSVLAENLAPPASASVSLSDASSNDKTVKLHRFHWNIHHIILLCVSILVRPSPFSPLHLQSFLLLPLWPISFLLCGFHSNGSPCPWRLSIPNQIRSCARRLQSFPTSLFTTSSFLFFTLASLTVSFTFFYPLCTFLLSSSLHTIPISVSFSLVCLSSLSVFQFFNHIDAMSQCWCKFHFSFRVFSDMQHLVCLSGPLLRFTPWHTSFKKVKTEQSHSNADQNNQWKSVWVRLNSESTR